jgi:hypothetical protein
MAFLNHSLRSTPAVLQNKIHNRLSDNGRGESFEIPGADYNLGFHRMSHTGGDKQMFPRSKTAAAPLVLKKKKMG